jgi:hypothetical protein
MFKLLVSKTLSSRAMASLAFGPGIAVLTTGPLGSLGKKGVSEDIWQRKTSGRRAVGTRRSWVARRGFIEGCMERKRAALAIDRRHDDRRDPLANAEVLSVPEGDGAIGGLVRRRDQWPA